LRVLWFVTLAAMLPLFVVLAPVALALLPLLAPMLLAIGPLNALVHEPDRCVLCRGAIARDALVSLPGRPIVGPARVIDLQRVRRLRRLR
jgi:hypothetical protein